MSIKTHTHPKVNTILYYGKVKQIQRKPLKGRFFFTSVHRVHYYLFKTQKLSLEFYLENQNEL